MLLRSWVIRFILSCLALVGLTPFVLADGVVRDSVGATSSGRGGTNLANFDNGAILLNNPAGMVNIDGTGMFEIGFDSLSTDLDYSDLENSTNGKFRPITLPEISFIHKSPDGNWAAGLGAFVPAGFGGEWNITNPIFGKRGYKSFGAMAQIMPGLGVRVTDRLSLGGNFGVAISHAELEGPFFLQTGPLSGVPTLFDLQATGAAPTWTTGLQYQLSDRTMFGMVYHSETRFRLDGRLRADIFGLGPDPVASNFDADVDLVWPRSAGFGFLHALNERHRLSADVFWFDWSHAFDRIDLRLTNASNPALGALGPEVTDSFALDWWDSVSLRLGYEFFLTPADILRAGYVYNSRTVPSSTLTPYIPATLEHTFSLGYGKRWHQCHVDLAYQFAFGPERSVGVSEIVGGDFSFSEVKAQTHWLFLSFTYHF